MANLLIIKPDESEINSLEIEENHFESTILDTAEVLNDLHFALKSSVEYKEPMKFMVELNGERIELAKLAAVIENNGGHSWLEDYFDLYFKRPLKDRSWKG